MPKLTSSLRDFYVCISAFPCLLQLEFSVTTTFLNLCIRHWTTLTDHTGSPLSEIPEDLLSAFSAMLQIQQETVRSCWKALAYYIATLVPTGTLGQESSIDDLISQHSVNGIGGDVLGPPVSRCINEICPSHNRPLTQPITHIARLFTLRRKVLPVLSESLCCQGCNTRYYHNYYVSESYASHEQSQRTYYSFSVPNLLHVQSSTFVDLPLCNWFRSMFAHQNTSVAIADVYNECLGKLKYPLNFTLSSEIDKDVVCDAFFLHAVLRDKEERQETLLLPHNAPSSHLRLEPALRERNHRLARTSTVSR